MVLVGLRAEGVCWISEPKWDDTDIDVHTRTGIRWAKVHSETYTHKISKHAACSAVCMQPLAKRPDKTTTKRTRWLRGATKNMHDKECRTKNQKEESKRRGGGTSRSTLRTNRRGEGFESGHAGSVGLDTCVHVNDEPICARLHVRHRVMGWKKNKTVEIVEERGEGFKKVVGKDEGQGIFKHRRLPTAFILLLL